MHKLRLLLVVPLAIIFSLFAIFVGLFSFGGVNLEAIAAQANPALSTIVLLLLRIGILPFQLLFIMLLFIFAFAIHRVRERIAQWLLRGPFVRKWIVKPSEVVAERALHGAPEDDSVDRLMERDTAVQVTGSAISFSAYTIAIVLSLGQFLSLANMGLLVTVVTGGLSWGARTLIGDLLGGMSNIAENNFSVGDRIAFFYANQNIGGTVESVSVRIVRLRATTGELYIIPHGELRVMHNFSRGEFSGTYVDVIVPSHNIDRTVALLETLADVAPTNVGNLQAPWQVIARTGEVTESTSISLFCKAVPGDEETLRLNVMAFVIERLAANGIVLAQSEGGA